MHFITFKCMFIVILNILPTFCKISNRSYNIGAQKRKKKQRAEEEQINKIRKFLNKENKEPNKPKASTTVSHSRDIHPIPDTESGTSSCKEFTSKNETTNIKIYKPKSSKSTENSASKNKQKMLGYGVI